MRKFVMRRSSMLGPFIAPLIAMGALLAFLIASGGPRVSAQAPEHKAASLDPAALVYKLAEQIQWHDDPVGAKMAVLQGDPSKPGLYVVLVKWTPHHMSHPHFHPNDRFITVLSGTWWVGTGAKFDPESTVPMPPARSLRILGNRFTTMARRTARPFWKSLERDRPQLRPPKRNK